MRDRSKLVAPLLALLLVASAVAGAGTVAAQEDDGESDTTLPEADEAYVKENGDVVLVYNDSAEGSQTQFGLDVSKNVFHALVVANDTGAEASQLSGHATAILEQDRLLANGSLSAPQPESVESLSFEASAEQTEQNAKGDLSLSTTIRNEGAAGSASLLQSADASGEMTVTPDRFLANGQFDAQLQTAIGPAQSHSFSLTESDGSYLVEAAQDYTVSEYSKDRWNTRERARQTLEQQYGSLARSLGGSSEVTISSYSFTETRTGARLDIAYTIRYTGVDEGLERRVTSMLANSEDYDLSRDQAQSVAENVSALQVNEISGQFEQTERGSVSGQFTADVEDYEGAIRSALVVAQSMQTPSDVEFAGQLDTVRQQLDARRAANLTQTYSFQASVASPSRQTTEITASAEYRTQNWAEYVSQLKQRDLYGGDFSVQLSAETAGDEIVAEGEATFSRENLLQEATDTLLNGSGGQQLDEDTRKVLRAFKQADLRKARMDVDYEDGQMTLEAGAAFQDLAALRDAVSSSTDMPKIAGAVGRTEGDQARAYVTVSGAVESGADESAVRALDYVGEDTTVHMPGDYDRSFPETNVTEAYDYLGLDAGSADGDGGGGPLGQPGFGAGAAVVALLGAALIAARRRSE